MSNSTRVIWASYLTFQCLGMFSCATSQTHSSHVIPKTLQDTAAVSQNDAGSPTETPDYIAPARTLIRSATQQAHDQARQKSIGIAHRDATLFVSQSLHTSKTTLGLFDFILAETSYKSLLEEWKNPTGSMSVGTTSRGSLIGSRTLPVEGEHHIIIARARPRNTNYGHPTTINILLHAAKYVAKTYPDAKLAMGNIAYKNGGDIRWSVSHNSGRDADIAFYVKDAMTGEPVDAAPDLMMFDDDGRSKDVEGYLFDVERNWQFVRGLLDYEQAQIQYVFISDGLKALLLQHAMNLGEPEDVIAMASDILRQPAEALPHDDHFHLRMACDLKDRLRGCVDRGPRWEWGNWHEQELAQATYAMIPALQDADPQTRLEALDYVLAIDSPIGAEFALGLAAYNDLPEVRQKAIEVGTSFWSTTEIALVTAENLILDPDTDLNTRAHLYAMLRRSRHESVIDFALAQLNAPTLSAQEKKYAARALSHHMKAELIPTLIDQLQTQSDPQVRAELSEVLRRIANRQEDIEWERASTGEVTQALKKWSTWWESHKELPREDWLAEGMASSLGVEKDYALTASSVEDMINAIPDAPTYLLYNINRSLREITGKWSSLEQSDPRKLHKKWTKWWRKHKHEFNTKA